MLNIDELTQLMVFLDSHPTSPGSMEIRSFADRELKACGYYWQFNNLVPLDSYWDRLHSCVVKKGKKIISNTEIDPRTGRHEFLEVDDPNAIWDRRL